MFSFNLRAHVPDSSEAFHYIYVDMNSFFASVAQQEEPHLRGKPVGIITVDSPRAACIAASYEAKRHGIGMGTKQTEALEICPDMAFRTAKHDLYVDYHHRIHAAVERIYPVEEVHSVDEYSCHLIGRDMALSRALELCENIRASIYEYAGEALRCSIGVGPSKMLAKLAGELHKPSGTDWLAPSVMPQKISHLEIEDIPGIGKNMGKRLRAAGVHDVTALYAMEPKRARKVWNSVTGERFILALQGKDITSVQTQNNSLGHGQILSPINRTPENARLVARRLLIKAATRLRRADCLAASIYVSAKCAERGKMGHHINIPQTQDTFHLLQIFNELWAQLPLLKPLSVSIMLGHMIERNASTGDLFEDRPSPGQHTSREKLCSIVDELNQRHGQDTIIFGEKPPYIAPYTGAKIAFGRIPKPEEFRD
jgi:DNA polymerase-4